MRCIAILFSFFVRIFGLEISEVNVEKAFVEFSTNADFSDKLGNLTHEEIIKCEPKLNGVFEYTSQNKVKFYPKNGLAKGKTFTCENNFIFRSPEFEVSLFRGIDDKNYEIIFNDEISQNLKGLEVFEKNNLAQNKLNFTAKSEKNRLIITLSEYKPNLFLKIAKNFISKNGASLNENYEKALNFATLKHAPRINTTDFDGQIKIIPFSFDDGKIGFRLLSKEWIRLSKKHIVISGVKDFGVSWASGNDFYDSDDYKAGFWYGLDIKSDDFKPNHDYQISLMPGFGSDDKNLRLQKDFNITTGEFLPYAKFVSGQNFIPKNADIAFKSVNISEVNIAIEKLGDQNFRYFLNFDDQIDNKTQEVVSKNFAIDSVKNEFSEHKIKFDFKGFEDGVYKIKLNYKVGDELKSISQIAYLSDLSAIVTRNDKELNIHAFRLSDASNLSGAVITLYSHKNEAIFQGNTDDKGNLNIKLDKFNPKSVTIRKFNESGFVILSDAINDTRYQEEQKYKALIYLTSEILRPNESLQGAIVVRDEKYKPLKNMPIKIQIFDPKHAIFKEFAKNTDEYGLVSLDENMGEESGDYLLKVKFENEELGFKKFGLENFVPNKTKNEILSNKNEFLSGEIVELNLLSNYLFGGVASGLDASLNENYSELILKPKNYSDFSFVNEKIYTKSILGENNHAFKTLASPKQIAINPQHFAVSNAINLNLNFGVRVGNKSSNEYKNLTIYPYSTLTAIKSSVDYAKSGEKVSFDLLSLSPLSHEKLNRELQIQIYEKDYRYYYYDDHFEDDEKYELVDSFDTNESKIEYKFANGGDYLVVAYDTLSGSSASVGVFVGGYGAKSNVPDSLKKAKIVLNQKNYKAGDTLTLSVISIIEDGVGVLNLGNEHKIFEQKIVKIKNGKAEASFKLPDDFSGGFVNATIFRASNPAPLPLRTFGEARIKPNLDNHKANLEILAPKTAKNNSEINIQIKTEPNAKIVAFIADEGALSVVDQKELKAFEFFNFARKNPLKSYDILDNLDTYQSSATSLSFGSDKILSARAALKANISPVKQSNIKTFVLTKVLKSDEFGKAELKFDTPNAFNSQLRVSVMALNDQKIASANEYIKVADDIVISTAELIYLNEGDKLGLGINIINTTNDEKNLTLSLNPSENLSFNMETAKFTLKARSNINFITKIRAKNKGNAEFSVSVSDENDTFKTTKKLNIYSPFPLGHESQMGFLPSGSQKSLFVPSEYDKFALLVSSSPSAILEGFTTYLAEYPYGCSEQISSKILALDTMPIGENNATQIQAFINSGIIELVSRLRPNGAISYWRGGKVDEMASLYAIDVLLHLNKTRNFFSKAQTDLIFGYLNGKFSTPKNTLYASAILSQYGKIDNAKINYLYDNKIYANDYLSGVLMSYILHNAGLINELESVQSKNIMPVNISLDDLAYAMYYTQKMGLENSQLKQRLINLLGFAKNTHQKALVLRAFSQIGSDEKPKFSLNFGENKQNFEQNLDEIYQNLGTFDLISQSEIYYLIDAYDYVALAPKSDFDSQKPLSIKRNFINSNGEKINLNSLKIGDIVYSDTEIYAKSHMQNVVLDEQISSCFEAINPRLNPNALPKANFRGIRLDYQDIKDERVLSFFGGFGDEKIHHIYTPYRVVMSGECVLPAIKIENMGDESMSDYAWEMPKFNIKQ